jgi:hypothetical protein
MSVLLISNIHSSTLRVAHHFSTNLYILLTIYQYTTTKQHIMQNSKLATKKNRPTAQTVVPTSNAAEDTHVHQAPSPALSKISRETSAQAVSGQSLTPPDASINTSGNGNEPPHKVRGLAAIRAFQNKCSPSSTADEDRNVSVVSQPSPLVADPYYSQPAAFQVDGSYDVTQTRTTIPTPPTPVPVPSALSW